MNRDIERQLTVKAAVQVALVKGRAGVYTSIRHYAKMWDAAGVRNACVYHGPDAGQLKAADIDIIDAPRAMRWIVFAYSPAFHQLKQKILRVLDGVEPEFILAHTDRTIGVMRVMFPRAVIAARCHSDNFKHKQLADLVLTLNPDQHQRASRTLQAKSNRVVLAGHPFSATSDSKPDVRDGPPRVNFVGRFVSEKRPDTFIQAMQALRTRPAPLIRMIGDGPMRGEMERAAAAAGLNVEFPGWRTRPLDDFGHNDVLVVSSSWEGLSWLLLEAQSLAVPVIASAIPANLYALNDGMYGDVFPVEQPDALAEKVETALADLTGLRAKARLGRATLEDRFGATAFWNRISDRIHVVRGSRRELQHVLSESVLS
ncbi:MAG: glycosyltransferase [Pseudomonadota bacterium]